MVKTGIAVVLGATAFLAGTRYSSLSRGHSATHRRILYYQDPMHPGYHSDRPGIAPDCGMRLEPVFADAPDAAEESKIPSRPCSVQVSRDVQQIVGVETTIATQGTERPAARLFGRVAADEGRIVRVVTATDGWVQAVFPASTANAVQKDELLVSFYSREFVSAQEAFIYGLNARDRLSGPSALNSEQVRSTAAQMRATEETLRALGMGTTQMREIATTREIARNVAIRAPISGVVLSRNIAVGQRFERNTELYRLADLRHIWVLADVSESEAPYIRARTFADVPYQGRTFRAKMTDISPVFDPISRTLKVRFEVDNPDLVLKPDMFVDINVPLALPAGITVPADAVLDSGLAKTVYVEYATGTFEPRLVETGWRFGDRVQVIHGLQNGERVVTAGNFLLDSESRVKRTTASCSPSDASAAWRRP